MGADLILAFCPLDRDHDDVQARIAALSDDELTAAYRESMQIVDDEDDLISPEEIREKLRETAHACYHMTWRGLADVRCDGRIWAISGGMSWGDTPEAYDDVQLLATTGVTYPVWERVSLPLIVETLVNDRDWSADTLDRIVQILRQDELVGACGVEGCPMLAPFGGYCPDHEHEGSR